jgi:hypothetical protein
MGLVWATYAGVWDRTRGDFETPTCNPRLVSLCKACRPYVLYMRDCSDVCYICGIVCYMYYTCGIVCYTCGIARAETPADACTRCKG